MSRPDQIYNGVSQMSANTTHGEPTQVTWMESTIKGATL